MNDYRNKIIILFLVALVFVFTPLTSYGALPTAYSDPQTHFNAYGEDLLYMSDHTISFGEKLSPTTAKIRTQIIGYTTTVTANGQSAKVIWKQGNSYASGWTTPSSGFTVKEKRVGTTGYWLYKISYARLHDEVNKINPTLGNYLARGDYNVSIRFDAITEVYNAEQKKTLDGPNYTLSESRAALEKYGISKYVLDPYYGMMMSMAKSDLPVVNYVSKSINFPSGGNYYSGGTYYVQPDKEINIATKYRSNIVNLNRSYLKVGDIEGGADLVDDMGMYFDYESTSSPYGTFGYLSSSTEATMLTGAGSTSNNADRDAHTRFDFRLRGDGKVWHAYSEAKNNRNMFEGGYAAAYRSLYRFQVDGSAPSISGRLSSNWRNTDASFTAVVSDNVSGVKDVKYYRNGSLIQTVTPTSKSTGVTLSTQNATASTSYRVVMTDNVGNSTTSDFELNIDKVAPSINLVPSSTGWTNSDVNISYSASDTGGSGFKSIVLPNGTTTNSSSGTFSVSTSGTYKFVVSDVAGNSYERSVVVYIDKTLPTATLTSGNTSWTNGNVALNLTSISDTGGSGFSKVELPNGSVVTSASNLTYDVGANGTYTFKVYDKAGNVRSLSITVSNIDKTIPVGNVSASTTAWTNGNVTLSLSGVSDSGGSGFKNITLPNGSVVTTSSASYVVSSNGTYSFKIEDNAGNVTTKSYSVSNIDKVVPVIGGDVKSPSSWTNGSVSLSITGVSDSGGSGLKHVKLPNGSISTNFASTYSVSSNGTYAFEVVDNAGNTRVRNVSVTNIDKTLPTATLTSGNTSWTNGNVTLNLTSISDTGGSGFSKVELPNGSVVTSASNLTYNVGANGVYTFKVYDNAGNVRSLSITVSNIDKTIPVGNVSASTTVWTNGNVTLSLSGVSDSGGSGFKNITLPNGSVVTTSSASYVVSSNGTYSFKIEDNAGNVTTKSYSVSNIDKVVPVIGGDVKSPSSWTNGSVSLSITGVSDSGGSGLKHVKLPNGLISTDFASTYSVSSNGTYAFEVVDNAGNTRVRNVSVTNIDKTLPTATLTSGNTSWTNGNVTLNLTSISDTGGSGFSKVELPNGSVVTSALNLTYDVGANGIYTFKVYDNAGNVRSLSITVSNIDKTIPVGNVSASTTAWTNGDVTLSLSGVSDNGGSGFKNITLPNGSVVTTSSASYVVSSNGTYSFKIADNAGNVTTKSYSVSNIDKVVPVIGGDVKSPSSWTNGSVSLSITGVSDSGGSGLKHVKLPNGSVSTNFASTYSVSSNGTYAFEVVDNAGNTRVRNVSVTNIDTSVPIGSISQTPTSWTNGSVTINVTGVSDIGGSGVKNIKLPDGSFVTGTSTSYVVTSNGSYSFLVTDNAGNTRNLSINVSNIDKSSPDMLVDTSVKTWTNKDVSINFSNIVDTGGSGYRRIRLPNGTYTTATSGSYAVSSNGSYSFIVEDLAGNVRTKTVTVSNIDKVPPVFSLVKTVNSWTNSDYDILMTGMSDLMSGLSRIELPDGSSVSYTGSDISYRVSSNGVYTFNLYDVAGNVFTASVTVDNIDKLKPGLSSLTLSSYEWSKPGVVITGNPGVDVGVSGVDRLEYRINKGVWSVLPGVGTAIPNNYEGNIVVEARTVDRAGNIGNVVSKTAKIDGSLPVISDIDIVSTENGFSVDVTANDDISGIRDYRVLVREIGTESSLRVVNTWSSSKTFDISDLNYNRAYEVFVDVRDLALNVTRSDVSYVVLPPDIKNIGVIEGDYGNNIAASWGTELRLADGISLEVYRSGSLIYTMDEGTIFEDRNLNFENKYRYTFQNSYSVGGEVIKSVAINRDVLTGVPTLELELDRDTYYKTIFSDIIQVSGYVSYAQGGTAILKRGKKERLFKMDPMVRNRFLYDIDDASGGVVRLTAVLVGREGIFDITKEAGVSVKGVRIKELDSSMYGKIYSK